MGMLWARGAGATVAVGLLALAALLAGGASLSIDELRVPDAVRNGSEESVVLDCDYSLHDGDNPSGLVVKWYFNMKDSPLPVYQWIPEKKPQVFGILRGRLNLDYRASEDKFKVHRALQITNPSHELSGNYTCTVSTFFNETSKTKRLIVYVPERSMEVTQTKSDNAAVNVTCSAEGVFPKPNISIQRQEKPGSEEALVLPVLTEDGLYDMYASVVLEDKVLTSPTTFYCELSIPEANYTATRSSIYTPGPPTTTTDAPPTTSTENEAGPSLPVGTNGSAKSAALWCLSLLLTLCLRL